MRSDHRFARAWSLIPRRLLSLVAVLLLLALPGAGTALAAGAAASSPLHMIGQAVVEQGQAGQRLVLSADAADGSGWRLDALLDPRAIRRVGAGFGDDGEAIIVLVGTYELSGPNLSMVTGRVSGQVNRQGVGQLQLAAPSGDTILKVSQAPLVASFVIGDSGQLSLDLSGPLPSPPSPGDSSATSQPVNHTFWYIARAAGFTAYGLLTLTVCLGLLVQTRALEWLIARWRSFDLHQFTALLALGFLALHIFSLLGDQYIGFQLDQLFIPLASPYRPAQVALGVVALYLLIIVVGSFYLRRSLSYGTWRAIHYATFAIFVLALAHGVLSGTDSGQPWAKALYWGSGTLVGVLVLWRIRHRSDPRRVPERPAAAPRRSPAEAAR